MLNTEEREALQRLRASNFNKFGLPEDSLGGGPPHCLMVLAAAFNQHMQGCESIVDLIEALNKETGFAVNILAARKAFTRCMSHGLVEHVPLRFIKAKRSLSQRYQSLVSSAEDSQSLIKAETIANIDAFREMCKRGDLKPRHGITVTYRSEPPLPVCIGKSATITITLTNMSSRDINVQGWDALKRPASETMLSDEYNIIDLRRSAPVPKGSSIDLTILYRPEYAGTFPTIVVIDAGRNSHFAILVPLEAESADSREFRNSLNLKPYIPRQPMSLTGDVATVGDPPASAHPRYRSALPPLKNQIDLRVASRLVDEFNSKRSGCPNYTPSNYCRMLVALWELELESMRNDLQSFSIEKAELKFGKGGKLVELDVPGLAEARPSVLRGDRIRIRDIHGKRHTGYVHKVLRDSVLISFHSSVVELAKMKYRFDVQFELNDVIVRKRFAAIEQSQSNGVLNHVLPVSSPFGTDLSPVLEILKLEWANKTLNFEQKLAVSNIVSRPANQLPFIIFGPPGTGKTSTVVEAVIQAARCHSDSRILVCAPSNSAVDVLLQRVVQGLGALAKQIVFRANAAFRRQLDSDVPEAREYSLYNEREEVFSLPGSFSKYRIVFCTLAFAQTVIDVEGGFDHPDFVFIDEAGHCDEGELLLCVSTLCNYTDKLRLILAGDPFQLGPIIHNKLASPLLGISLLERFMKQKPYMSSLILDEEAVLNFDNEFAPPASPRTRPMHYNSAYVVKLVNNYRSHEKLFYVSNRLFYEGELLPAASFERMFRFCRWEHLPNPRIPLIVHGVIGKHDRAGDSPSFFNIEELVTVKSYLLALQETRGVGFQHRDVGVISPYVKQCQMIRNITNAIGFKDAKVGSVEVFQGDERPVIILSTVRSVSGEEMLDPQNIANFLDFDVRHHLGFLRNAKRFNVAITRPQSLLIVVCNPHVMSLDRNWRALLQFALKHDCYKGTPFTLDNAVSSDLIERFKDLNLFDGESEASVTENLPRPREDF